MKPAQKTLSHMSAAVLACLCLGVSPAAAQDLKAVGLRYITFVTGDTAPEQPLPMVIALHSMSSTPRETLKYFDFGQISVPLRVVLPRGEYVAKTGYTWWKREDYRLPGAEHRKIVQQVARRLRDFSVVVSQRHATRGKPIVIGISQGGDLSFLLAVRWPENVAAAFPVVPRLPRKWWEGTREQAAEMPPIFVLNGADDPIVSAKDNRKAVQQMKRLGFPVEIQVYKKASHEFSDAMRRDVFARIEQIVGQGQESQARD